MSWNCPNTWSEVSNTVAHMWSFKSNPLKVSGHPMWVLSDPSRDLYGHTDGFTHELIAQCAERRSRYLHSEGGTGSREVLPEDVIYVVARDGNALLAVLGDGTVKVNKQAQHGLKRYATAIERMLPVLEAIPSEYRAHFTKP